MRASDTTVAPPPIAVVDPEFAALIPPLTSQERELLEASLLQEGCRHAISVWAQQSILLDGHNRLEICTRHGIPFTTRAVALKNREAAMLWVLNNQLGRRNLSDIDRIDLAAKREPLIKATASRKRSRRSVVPQNSAEQTPPMETRRQAAEIAGVSHDTFTKGKVVLDHGVPELLQAVREGSASIHAAAAVATLPAEEQREAVRTGRVKEEAKQLRAHIARSTGNDEWFTPPELVEAARTVLGGIDFDPASNDIAQKTVQAGAFFTKETDGLTKPWPGRVWLNPPYSRQLIGKFIDKLLDELDSGHTTAAILLVNAQTDAAWFQSALLRAAAVAFPSKRIRFLRPNGKPSEHGPLQGQAFLYFGQDQHGFAAVFDQFGAVLLGNAAGQEVVA
jgi:hypothetical protein